MSDKKQQREMGFILAYGSKRDIPEDEKVKAVSVEASAAGAGPPDCVISIVRKQRASRK